VSQDSKHTPLMYAIAGEGVGKVGFLVILAFVFVPQWVEYSGKEADCSDLWSVPLFGHGSLQCLQRRLTADQRQRQFTRLMTGPFVVAPFIAILLKFIVARIVDRLNVGLVITINLVVMRAAMVLYGFWHSSLSMMVTALVD